MGVPDETLLELRDLRLLREGPRGATCVLAGLDLRLRRGEHVAVVGANGSGKSSLLRYLAMHVPVAAGLVIQDPDEQLVAATVAGELALGRPELDVASTLAAWGLAGRGTDNPLVLSAGQKQRLQVAVVLAGAPRLLLADEPSSLQDAAQAVWVRERLLCWRRETGGTLVWATQRREEIDGADRVLALDRGRVLALGPPAEVLARPQVAELLDRAPVAPAQLAGDPDAPPVAEWRDIGFCFPDGGGFAGLNVTLRPGDRLGITGPSGCGKSTLLAMAAGLRRPDAGTVCLGGLALYRRGEVDLDHGLAALAPQFPEYLFTQSTVAREIAVDPALADAAAPEVLARVGLAAEFAGRNPHDLSGGERRRLALALALLSRRPLILLDEPTAALDAHGRAAVVDLVGATSPQAAIVIASHDEHFLRACGCRALGLA